MEGEELRFCLLELISDQGAAWPRYRQQRQNPWAYSSEPFLEKLQQQRSWIVGLLYGALEFLWVWTVERSQGIAIKSAVEFLLGRERKPNQGMYLNMCLYFFPQSWPTNRRLQWMINANFFCFLQGKFKKSILILFQWHGGFVPEYESIHWSEGGVHSPSKYFISWAGTCKYDLNVLVTQSSCWQVVMSFMTNILPLPYFLFED